MNRNTPRKEPLKGMRNMKGLISLLAGPRSAVLLVLMAHTGALHAQTPQQQAWNILRAGVNEKSTEKRTQAGPRAATSPRGFRGLAHGAGGFGRSED